MQNKGYTEAYADARLFVDFMGSTIDKVEQVVRKSNEKRQRINGEYQQLERQLQSTKSDADRMCSAEKDRRDNTARHAIEYMKTALADIKDPHFHRMESRYIRKCGRGTYVSDIDNPHTVKRKLKEAVDRFDELVADLNQAFIPPAISNVVGGVIRPYRKNSYVRIIKARDEILALAEALISFSDLDAQQRECGEVFNTRIEHGDQILWDASIGNFLKEGDTIIVLGDFGIGFFDGRYWPEEMFYDYLSEQKYTVLFVDGNHETFEKLNSFPAGQWYGGRVQFIRSNVIHLMRGETYDIDGKKLFCFGGGYSLDKDYRVQGRAWWPQEIRQIALHRRNNTWYHRKVYLEKSRSFI